MNFEHILPYIKHGHKATRSGWNGKGMFIYLVLGSVFKVNRPPLMGVYPEGTLIEYLPHIDMCTNSKLRETDGIRSVDGPCVPWLASQTDILAEDWDVIV
jgi:hypothetical protein